MKDILEIIAAMLAAIGLWSLFDLIKFHILYPVKIRSKVVAAVYKDDSKNDLSEAISYVKYLKKIGKLNSDRLIILGKDDIIKNI